MRLFLLFSFLLSSLFGSVHAAPAFPGVVGFGANTQGGRGGDVIIVSNTSGSGPGSWEQAMSSGSTPKIIVFTTGGVLPGGDDIPDNTTILGQTAPGDGVAIDGKNFNVGNNVIIRGVRFFAGRLGNGPNIGTSHDVVFDHNSVFWFSNESFTSWQNQAYGSNFSNVAQDVTISDNMIFEGLYDNGAGGPICPGQSGSSNKWEGHGFQFTPLRDATVIRNLLVNISTRAPRFAGPASGVEYVNNMHFMHNNNAGFHAVPFNSGVPGETGVVKLHAIGNVYRNDSALSSNGSFLSGSGIYIQDNIGMSGDLNTVSSPLFTSSLNASDILSRSELEGVALPEIGPLQRISIEQGAVNDYLSETKVFQCPDDLPNLNLASGVYPTDSDGDGMPDSFEVANGLNPSDASDAKDISPSGYANIEVYANGLFGETAPPENQAPVVDAGVDFSATVDDDFQLSGSVTDDGLPSGTLNALWTVISAPTGGNVTFTDNTAVNTVAFADTEGSYTLELSASDGQLSAVDTVSFDVTLENQAPVVDAGFDQMVLLGGDADLNGTASDDGLPNGTLSVQWTLQSGPGTVVFADPFSVSTTASFDTVGVYTLELIADDGALSSSDTLFVDVDDSPSCETALQAIRASLVDLKVDVSDLEFDVDQLIDFIDMQ